MSKLGGDKSRFQIDRKRKMLLRQRRQLALAAVGKKTGGTVASSPAKAPRKTASV
jgi:hypothetical protein